MPAETFIANLVERGVAIRSLSDGIDPSTRENRLMLNMMATFAEYERELIQERVQAGVDAAGANGGEDRRLVEGPVLSAQGSAGDLMTTVGSAC